MVIFNVLQRSSLISGLDSKSTFFKGLKIKKVSTFLSTLCGNCLNFNAYMRRGRDSNSWYTNRVRQFSKLLVSATHPPLQSVLC